MLTSGFNNNDDQLIYVSQMLEPPRTIPQEIHSAQLIYFSFELSHSGS